ncbi:MAG: 30S ribosomal protein S17 [Actinobacteria bacterium]|nr:30S ribosomal protein S17 [Actinomycetota bacterium]
MTQTKQNKRGLARTLTGTVVSAKANRTISVAVTRLVKHPRYGKYVRKTTRLNVHDPQDNSRVGDKVQIIQCRPVSKTKSWRIFKLIDRPEGAEEMA